MVDKKLSFLDDDKAGSLEIQAALYTITELTGNAKQVDSALLQEIHGVIKKLMYAENFFVAMVDNTNPDWVIYPYYCDTVDTDWTSRRPKEEFLGTLTGYVFRTREPLFATGDEIADMQGRGLFQVHGAMMVEWLGVPLQQGDTIFGAIVVQSYSADIRYRDKDKQLLTFVSQHIATALSRKRTESALQRLNESLEQRVAERTKELEQRERLQSALYRISDLSHSGLNLDQMYAEIHRIISKLIYTENFFIALLNDERSIINYPYFVDSKDTADAFKPRRMDGESRGLTDYLIRECKPLLINKELPLGMNINIVGKPPNAWLGVPLLRDGVAIGAIAAQSYVSTIGFTEFDKEIMVYVAKHISAALKRKQDADLLAKAHEDLKRSNDELEQRVKERTSELSATNSVLKSLLQEKDDAVALQAALFKIADITGSSRTMSELYAGIHRIVGELMYADNFYIALYDYDSPDLIGFPYFVDTIDTLALTESIPAAEFMKKTITGYLMKSGKPLFASGEEIRKMRDEGTIQMVGEAMVEWLGVPLFIDGEVLGALVVQSYLEDVRYKEKDKDLLIYVSQHIATAVTRKRAEQAIKRGKDELEARVEQRTQEITTANRDLEAQIQERERAERLQLALYKIANLNNSADNLYDFYRSIHQIIGELMPAENIYIAVADFEKMMLDFPYVADVDKSDYDSRPLVFVEGALQPGLTEQVLFTKSPLLLSSAEINSGALNTFGKPSKGWLGVPLMSGDQSVGVIAVQAYSEDTVYTEKHKDLLSFVSQHISTALQRKKDSDLLVKAHKELQQINDQLEQRVAERTQALEVAQKELLETAHRAGMSEIATGVLHNVGNILNSIATSVDALLQLQSGSRLETLVKANALIDENKNQLVEFLTKDERGVKVLALYEKVTNHLVEREAKMQEQLGIVQKCSRIIAEVISTQQKYAKGSLYREDVVLSELVEDAVAMKASLLARESVQVDRDYQVAPRLSLEKTKILNVLVNLVKNAAEAMSDTSTDQRRLFLRIWAEKGSVILEVQDTGCGVKPENLHKIFNHGFTTKSTGHGFGLHSCANAMREAGGSIDVRSDGEGKGTCFVLRFVTE